MEPLATQSAHYDGRAYDDGRHKDHADQRQFPVEEEQDEGDGDDAHDHVQGPDHAHVDEAAHRLDVGGGAGHQIASVFLIVEREADVLELIVEKVATVEGDFLRKRFSGVGAGEVAESATQADGQDTDAVKNQGRHRKIRPDELAGCHVPDHHQVDGVAEKPRQCEGKADGSQRGNVREGQPRRVAGGHHDDAYEDAH